MVCADRPSERVRRRPSCGAGAPAPRLGTPRALSACPALGDRRRPPTREAQSATFLLAGGGLLALASAVEAAARTAAAEPSAQTRSSRSRSAYSAAPAPAPAEPRASLGQPKARCTAAESTSTPAAARTSPSASPGPSRNDRISASVAWRWALSGLSARKAATERAHRAIRQKIRDALVLAAMFLGAGG